MSQQNFTPTGGSTHLDARTIYNANADDAESRLAILESSTVIASDIDSETAPDNYVLTADGAGNTAWEAGGGGGALFNVALVTGVTHTQVNTDSHHLYDDTLLGDDNGGSGSGSGSGSGGGARSMDQTDCGGPTQLSLSRTSDELV